MSGKRANREIARKISSPDIAGDKLYYRTAYRPGMARAGLFPCHFLMELPVAAHANESLTYPAIMPPDRDAVAPGDDFRMGEDAVIKREPHGTCRSGMLTVRCGSIPNL